VKLSLAPSSNAGAILHHTMQLVQHIVGQGLTTFKMGMTADPAHRWGNDKCGHQHEFYDCQQMQVLSEADSAGAAMLEASLIRKFWTANGCRNSAPGGESLREGCMIYTFIVSRRVA